MATFEQEILEELKKINENLDNSNYYSNKQGGRSYSQNNLSLFDNGSESWNELRKKRNQHKKDYDELNEKNKKWKEQWKRTHGGSLDGFEDSEVSKNLNKGLRQRGNTLERSNREYEKANRKIARVINGVAETISSALKTAGTIITSEMQKDFNNYSAEIQTATVDLETNSKVLTNNLKLSGQAIASSMTSTFSVLTSGIKEGAFNAANAMTDLTVSSVSTELENNLLRLKQSNSKILIEKERELKNYQENSKEIEAVTGTLVAATALIPGGQLASVAIAAGAGLVQAGISLWRQIEGAKKEIDLKKLELQYKYNEQQQQEYINAVNTLYETASNLIKPVLNLSNSIWSYTELADKNFKNAAKGLGKMGDSTISYTKKMLKIAGNLHVDGNTYLNRSHEQLAQQQQKYSETTGFAIELDDNDYLKSNLMGEIWDQNTVNDINASLQLYNHSVSSGSEMMFEMYDTARKMGLSQAKFSKELAKNLKLAEKHQFKGGVKGLMQMTAWAQKVRFNMDEFGSVLDKMKEGGFENAMTSSAQLQVLGGNFAMGADPLAMLWETYNDPAALGKRLNGMVRGMGTFNSKTGEVDFNMNDTLMLQSMAKATGQSVENLMNQARINVKSKHLEHLLKDSYSQKQKDLIISKATLDEDGNWKVNRKDINDLQESDFAELESIESGILYNVKDIAKMMSMSDKQAAAKEKSNADVASNTYDDTVKTMNTIIDQDLKFYKDNMPQITEEIRRSYTYMEKMNNLAHEKIINNTEAIAAAFDLLEDRATKDATLADQANNLIEGFKALQNGVDSFTEWLQKQGVDMSDYRDRGKIHDKDSIDKLTSDYITLAAGKYANFDNGESFGESFGTALKKYRKKDGSIDYKSLLLSDEWKNFALKGFGIGDRDLDDYIKKLGYASYNSISEKTLEVIINSLIKNMNLNKDFKKGFDNVSDGFITANGNPMFTSASSVTPIHDGSVQLAKSDPKDSALFAKSGGPFDTLFNGIFSKINEISDIVVPRSLNYEFPMKSFGDVINGSKYTTNNNKFQMEPIKIELNGKLELTNSNGQNIDIINEIRNNPVLLRTLTQLISESINDNINGGKSSYNSMMTTPRFRSLNF